MQFFDREMQFFDREMQKPLLEKFLIACDAEHKDPAYIYA